MMRIILICLLALTTGRTEELIIDTDSTTVDGGTYDYIEVSARYVTVRNATIRNTTGKNYYAAVYLKGVRSATIENCVIDGGASAVRGQGSCGGIKLDGCSRSKITNNVIYNMNDDGIRMYSSSLCDITDNTIYMLLSCGTDNGCSDCNNGHSDGIQAIGCIKVNILNNLIYDVRGTSALFMGNNPNATCRFITVANNILFTPDAAYTAYLQYTEDFDVFNNVVLGGIYGSIWYGTEMYRFRFQNNICGMHKLKDGGAYDTTQHTVSYNLWAELHPWFNLGTDNLSEVDPRFKGVTINSTDSTVTRADFALESGSPCINAGIDHEDIPTTDIYGNLRAGTTDMGAIEYGGISDIPYVSEMPVLDDLEVYPQPMLSRLTFTGSDLRNGAVSLKVCDTRGRVVFARDGWNETSSLAWDGSDLGPGIYTWYVSVDGMRKSGRIVKTR